MLLAFMLEFLANVNVNSRLRSLYAIARPSVCRLSSVTLVHPTQPVEIFGNVSAFFWYLGHLLTSTENFTEIVSGEPSVGRLNARGVAKYSDFGPIEGYVSETVQDRS